MQLFQQWSNSDEIYAIEIYDESVRFLQRFIK